MTNTSMSSNEKIFLTVHLKDGLVKKDQKSTSLLGNYFYGHDRVPLVKLKIFYLKQDQGTVPLFALFFNTKIL